MIRAANATTLRLLGVAATCVLLAAIALACGNGEDSPGDERLAEFEKSAEWEKRDKTESKDVKPSVSTEEAAETTARMAEQAGGQVQYVVHPTREGRSVLVLPQAFVDGETPLIVSLHGYGGTSATQAEYVPLHERVNTDGFALLLPTASPDAAGNPSWNPTDECCDGGKSGEDDVAYLTELVAEAGKLADFGPLYFFGYSNGGFMAHHLACKGLPGLRAVASIAGTSYVEDSSCRGAPPVSALHLHGTADDVILFDGDQGEPDPKSDGPPPFYVGARDMATRWSRLAGCEWPDNSQPYTTLELDRYVPGAETQAFRLESGCAGGIDVQLWVGEGSGHAPAYGDAFLDALLAWLLSQK